jgi:type I restriction enzyme S subunit
MSENNLPNGWIEVELSKLFDINYGKDFRKKDFANGDVYPVYSANGVIGYSNIFNRELETVVLGCRGSVGSVHLTKPKSYITHNCFSVEPKAYISTRFTYYLIKSIDYSSVITGTAQPQITITNLSPYLVSLPPLAEQKRIVAKLDAVFAKIETNKQRLEKIPKLLKRFRQSVLAAAVSGRLLNNEIKDIELGNLIEDLKYGTSQKSEKEINGIPVLRIPNIADDGKISIEDLKYSVLPEKEYEKLKLKEGDLLLIRSNGSVSLVGKSSMVTKQEEDFAYAGYLIRIRCNRKFLMPEFLNLALASYNLRTQIEIPARSTSGINNINSDEVKALKIPTPTIEEQREIVKRVEQLFAFADKLEARYTKAKAMLDKLPQSILAKAFRGELVPQNENDEPATVLLERIRKEKQSQKIKPAKPIKPYAKNDKVRMVAEG